MRKPFFSVIIPAYNRASFLEKAVSSVLEQTCEDLELIVVNDGSTDRTSETIAQIKDPRLVYMEQNNRGVANARNTAIKNAKGEFFAFLDSDDIWEPEKLSITRRAISDNPDIKVFHTNELWMRRGEVLPQRSKHSKPSGYVYLNALKMCCISISTAVVKKNIFDTVGLFDETFEACEDYDMWLRITLDHKVLLLPEILTVKDGGRPDQLSSRVWGLDRFRIRALEKMIASKNLKGEDFRATFSELEKKCRIFALGCEKRKKHKEAKYYRDLPLKYR